MTQQGDRQASVRAVTGTTFDYNGDWSTLFDLAGIPSGNWNGRLLGWINQTLGTAYTELNGAMQALAAANGAVNFSSMGTFAAGLPVLDAIGGVGPVAAYGMAKLRAAYAGPCCDLIRASDSATLTVGFVGRAVDAASIDVFGHGTTVAVTKWYDQSGNGNDAVQATAANQPQVFGSSHNMNGVRPISFQDAVFLNLPAGVAVNQNLFTAIGLTRVNGQGAFANFYSGGNVFSLGNPTEGFGVFFQAPDGYWAADNLNNYATQQRSISVPAFFGVLVNGATAYNVYQNEETKAVARTLPSVALTGGSIHNFLRFANYYGYMDMATLVIYGRALSSTEIASARQAIYLLGGITTPPTAQVVYVGDSITSGYSSVEGHDRAYDDRLSFSQPAITVNKGLPGVTMATISGAAGNWAPAQMVRAAYRRNIIVLLAGTNDIIASTDAATIYAAITTYVAAAQAAGFKIIVSTITPRTGFTSPMQAVWNALNVLIRANAAAADAIADLQSDPTMGPFAAAANTSLYKDGTHPTTLGFSLLSAVEGPVINGLLL